MFINEIDETEQVLEQEFDEALATREILEDKFGEESYSDEATNFIGTEEFNELFESKQKTATEQVVDNTETKVEEAFDLKKLDEDNYDLSNLKAGDLKKAINNQNKEIRESYEQKTQETIKELEITKKAIAEKSQENKEFGATITALPDFLEKKFGVDASNIDFKKELQDFVLNKAAETAGLSVAEYVAKANQEKVDAELAISSLKENVDKAYKDFSEDESFKALDIANKEETLKQHLIDNKFNPEKDDIKKISKILFMEQYENLIREQAIAEALKHNSDGSPGKLNTKGKPISNDYDPKKDVAFQKELKELGFKEQ